MIFKLDLAIRIVEIHQLSPKTISVWRTRGYIPDKYLEDPEPDYNTNDLEMIAAATAVIKNPDTQLQYITNQSGVKYTRLQDARQGRYKLKKSEAEKIMYVIEKGVPLPEKGGKGSELYKTLEKMDVEDSFVVPADDAQKARLLFKKIENKKFVTRKEEDKIRIWRIK